MLMSTSLPPFAEFFRQPALQLNNGLIANFILVRRQAVGLAEFLLWQALHAEEQTALIPRSSRPISDGLVDPFPSPEIEVSDAEIGSGRQLYRLAKRGEKLLVDIVEDSWQRGEPLLTC